MVSFLYNTLANCLCGYIILLHHNYVATIIIICMNLSTVSRIRMHFIVILKNMFCSQSINVTKIDSGSSGTECDGQCMQFVWTSLYSWSANNAYIQPLTTCSPSS